MEYQKYQENKTAKKCFSVQQEPLLFGLNDPGDKILDLIPVPMLHVLLGIVNKTYKSLVNTIPKSAEWPRILSIHQEHYHGDSFEGNESKKLLNNVGVLEGILNKKCLKKASPFIKVLKSFKIIIDLVYDKAIDLRRLENAIEDFKIGWKDSNMSLITKAHIVIDHLFDFVSARRNTSMAFYSEQSHESAHCEVDKTWSRYFVKEQSNPQYMDRLLRCVLDFNAQHSM